MSRTKRNKPMPLRNWAAVAAWNLKGETHQDKRKKRERKYPKSVYAD